MPKVTFHIKLKVLNNKGEYVDCTYSEYNKGPIKIEKIVSAGTTEVKVAGEILTRYNKNLSITSKDFSLPLPWVVVKTSSSTSSIEVGSREYILNYDNGSTNSSGQLSVEKVTTTTIKYTPGELWSNVNSFTGKGNSNGIKLQLNQETSKYGYTGIEITYTYIGGIKKDISVDVYLWQQAIKTTTSNSNIIDPKLTLPIEAIKPNYIFDHWRENYTDPNPKNHIGILPGSVVTLTKSITYFLAVYKGGKIKFNINPNGGNIDRQSDGSWSGSTEEEFEVTYGIPTDLFFRLSRSAYKFNGFKDNNQNTPDIYPVDGNEKINLPAERISNFKFKYFGGNINSTTYNCQWTPIGYKLKYKLEYGDLRPKFFNGGSTTLDYIEQDYNTESDSQVKDLSDLLIGYNFSDTFKVEPWTNWAEPLRSYYGNYNYKIETIKTGSSLNNLYGNAALSLPVTPIKYEISYTEKEPILVTNPEHYWGTDIISKYSKMGIIIELKKVDSLPTEYTILDEIDLTGKKLLVDNTTVKLSGDKLLLGLGRGFYFTKNNYKAVKTKEGNWNILTSNPAQIKKYSLHEKVYFYSSYLQAKYKFIFNYKYNDGNETKEGEEIGFLDSINKLDIGKPVVDDGFTFGGWEDDSGVLLFDAEQCPVYDENNLKYIWKTGESYYLIAEKGEDQNNPKEINLYPRWIRNTGLKVNNGKEFVSPIEEDSSNIDFIKIFDGESWNIIKQIAVYGNEKWNYIGLKHRPDKPTNRLQNIEEYEEI